MDVFTGDDVGGINPFVGCNFCLIDWVPMEEVDGELEWQVSGGTWVKDLRKQNILFAKSFLRRLHKSRVSFAQHSLTNFTCLLLKE
ncbi:hypothetical protein SUGI_0665480 [Cryptomeria japonica]|nr:hypothetical protein SUGI_0665480 [Cryptomeria japonica]